MLLLVFNGVKKKIEFLCSSWQSFQKLGFNILKSISDPACAAVDETEDVSSSWPESSVENVTSRRNSNSYVLEKRSAAAASSSLIFVKLYLSRAAAAECQHKPSDLSEFCQKKAQPRVTSFQSKSWIGVKKNRNNIHSKIRPAEFGATVHTVTVWQDILQQ